LAAEARFAADRPVGRIKVASVSRRCRLWNFDVGRLAAARADRSGLCIHTIRQTPGPSIDH
jgi:hypothetical protein